ncbi:hypothetical protein HAX54_035752, partial [Datura stramonium]|nr:hypothetical protein [Datura stramonium]
MRRISLRNNGIPFLSSFVIRHCCSEIRVYSSSHSKNTVKGKHAVHINIEKEVKCLDDAVTLFHRMVRMQPLPSVLVFCKLFKTIVNLKHYSALVSLFREMRKLGIPIDVFILNIVTNSYCLMHRVDCAFSVLPIYLKNGIPFNVVTFNTLLRGIFAENKVKDAVELFKNAIMDGYCLCGQLGRARRIFDILIDKGIEPSIFSYNILINGYCKKKNLSEAMQLFHEISQNGPKPNIVTCNTILQGLFEVGRIGDAKIIYTEMLSTGSIPNFYTYCTLLNGYFKCGLVEEAMLLFNKLEEKRENTRIEYYNIVINGLCKNGKLDEGRAIFEKLSFIGLLPNVRTYNTMINGFCLEGLFDEAK